MASIKGNPRRLIVVFAAGAIVALVAGGVVIDRRLSQSEFARMTYANLNALPRSNGMSATEQPPITAGHSSAAPTGQGDGTATPEVIAANGLAGEPRSPEQVMDRLGRLQEQVNRLWGGHFTLTLGAPRVGAVVEAGGMITLDLGSCCSLSEGALVGLIGQAISRSQAGSGAAQGAGAPQSGAASMEFGRLQLADERAGWAIGALGHPVDVLDELVAWTRQREAARQVVSGEYLPEHRSAALRRGYEEGQRFLRSQQADARGLQQDDSAETAVKPETQQGE